MRLVRAALILFLSATALLTATPARAEAALEAQVMSKIRAARPSALILHTGLQAAARMHSMGMSRRGGLDHNDADARVNNAPPDPAEGNGAPDDGFAVAAWCENVTYSMAVPESQVAQRIYDQWHRSGAHDRCMQDSRRNVGAVGIYYDGQTWWATFIAEDDSTPPGGAPAAKPEPSADPVATQAPPKAEAAPVASTPATQPLPSAETDPVGEAERQAADAEGAPTVIGEDDEAPVSAPPTTITVELDEPMNDRIGVPSVADTDSIPFTPLSVGYGWQELSALVIVLALATFFLRRAVPRVPKPSQFVEWAAEMERRDDVTLPEIEPVGVPALRS
jgi:hypothetical protein